MQVKLQIHILPWEIDYMQTAFLQLKKSKFFLPKHVNLKVDTVLNLSNHIIDWERSSISKQFFKDKLEAISLLLVDYEHSSRVYEGDDNYGHLDSQREGISPEVDYYIVACPDTAFSEHLVPHLCMAAELVSNEHFLITPQINKMWDSSWDCLVNPLYMSLPYDTTYECDSFTIMHNQSSTPQELSLVRLPNSKFAGWFDLYNKKLYEELIPIWDDWHGYGAWDYYSMMVTSAYRQQGGDFQQYLLRGETIVDWTVGPWGYSLANYYKKQLKLKEIPNYGAIFQEKVYNYAIDRISKFNKKQTIIYK